MEVCESQIEKFELVGEGNTAQVFRGCFAGEVVAVKQFSIQPTGMSPKELMNVTRELEIMRRVRHPRLANLIGLVLRDLPIRVVMEFCSGGNLFELLHSQDIDLSWVQNKKIMTDIGVAVEYLHGFNPRIVHRDLKSLNMLLEEPIVDFKQTPRVKVSDFGLARVIEEVGCHTFTKEVGTHHWMAPEVFMSNNYDCKVDIYSFAIIMYEVICRDIPYADLDKKRVGLFVASGGRPDLRMVLPGCPSEFVKLMCSCWAQDPEKRPDFPNICATLHNTRLGPYKSDGYLGGETELCTGAWPSASHCDELKDSTSTTDTTALHERDEDDPASLISGDDSSAN